MTELESTERIREKGYVQRHLGLATRVYADNILLVTGDVAVIGNNDETRGKRVTFSHGCSAHNDNSNFRHRF